MGRIEWFDDWQSDIRKKTYDELDTGDKALLRATMYQTADELVGLIDLVTENVPVPVHTNDKGRAEINYSDLEAISIEDCWKCFQWFFEGDNSDKISYKYQAAWGEETQYMNLMCPASIYVNIYHSELLDLKKYQYKTRTVKYETVNYAQMKVTHDDGREEILNHDDFERIYRIEDTDIPYHELDPNLYRHNRSYIYEPGLHGSVTSRNGKVFARVLTEHEESVYDNGDIAYSGKPGDYAIYKINKYHGGECAYIYSKRIISKEDFEKLLEPVTA